MATEIKRYEFQPATKLSNSTIMNGVEYYLDPSGRWVRYADHEAKVRALEELLKEATDILDRVVVGGSKYGWYEVVTKSRALLNPSTKKGSSHE